MLSGRCLGHVGVEGQQHPYLEIIPSGNKTWERGGMGGLRRRKARDEPQVAVHK